VADLVIRGQTNREIAETLIVSERTIDNHVQRMFAKLGITRRSDLSAALKLSTE
jgi:DNA-binding CsgD family transcriptional regulator